MPLITSPEYRGVVLPSMPFDMDFSNDGTLLACATHSDDQAASVVRILRTEDGALVKAFMEPSAESCKGVAFVAQGKELVFLLQREEGSTELHRAALTSREPKQLQSYAASAHNHSIVRDHAGEHFAVLGNHLELWDVRSGEIIRSIPSAERFEAVHAAFSRDGEHLYVYGTTPKEVVGYDVSSGLETGRWEAPTPFGAQVLVTPNERFLAVVGSSYKGVFVYDLSRGERLSAGPGGAVKLDERTQSWPWATSPDSSLLVCQKLSPWAFRLPDLFHYRPSHTIVAPGARCLSAAWAWDAPIVAFGTLEDATVRWFPLVEAEGDEPHRDVAGADREGAGGGPAPTSSGKS
jgi:WD40 repeat protein